MRKLQKLKCAGSKIVDGKNCKTKPNSMGILLVKPETKPTKFAKCSCSKSSHLKTGPKKNLDGPAPPETPELSASRAVSGPASRGHGQGPVLLQRKKLNLAVSDKQSLAARNSNKNQCAKKLA